MMKSDPIANAIDEARERMRAAEFHTPGGKLLASDYEPIIRGVARAHHVCPDALRRAVIG